MANFGVNFKESTLGTGLMKIFSDAAATQSGNAIDLAKLDIALQQAALDRENTRATIGHTQHATVNEAMEAARKQQIQDALTASGDIRGKEIFDAQNIGTPPVVVEPAAATAPWTPTVAGRPAGPVWNNTIAPPAVVEPDFEYRVNQYPLRSDAAPVPVEPNIQLPPLAQGPQGMPPELINSLGVPMPPALDGRPAFTWPGPSEPSPLPESMFPRRGAPVPVIGALGNVVGEQQGPVVPGVDLMTGQGRPTGPLPSMPLFERTPPAPLDYGLEPPVPVELPNYMNRPEGPTYDVDASGNLVQVPGSAEAGPGDNLQAALRSSDIPFNPLPPGVPPDLAIAAPVPVGETIAVPGRTTEPPAAPRTAGAETPTALDLPDTKTTDNGDGTVTATSPRGTMRLTRAEANILGLVAAYANDPAGQTGREAANAGYLYNENIGLTPGQRVEALATGKAPGRESVLGTDEAIRKDLATEGAKPKYQVLDKQLYEVFKDPKTGESRKVLVAGGEAVADPNAPLVLEFGPEGKTETSAYNLITKKPDSKTWNRDERLFYNKFVKDSYGADVKVGADGEIVVVAGEVPQEWLPAQSGAAAAPAASTVVGEPGTAVPQPGGVPTAPAVVTPPPGKIQKDAKGRTIEVLPDGTKVVNHGGWLAPGEEPKKTDSTVAGQRITQVAGGGPKKDAESYGKIYSFTDQAIEPAEYFLKRDFSKGAPSTVVRTLKSLTDDTLLEPAMNSGKFGTMSEDDREFMTNVIELVKDFSHKDSGADVTANDLQTYLKLYDMPGEPTAKDWVNFQKRVLSGLGSARRGLTGNIMSDKLRALDIRLAQKGIDLDANLQPGEDYEYEER